MLREIIIENCDLLCHFFDSIDRVISKFVRIGGYAEERDLTFLLCEQLDKDSPIQANIGTSLSLLNDKLKGMKIEIEIKKHNQRVEGAYSNADIGIITDLSGDGEGIRKAILLQAKILNPYNNIFEYQRSFYFVNNKQQNSLIKNPSSSFYALYNPQMHAFNEIDQTAIKNRELMIREYLKDRNKVFTAIDEYYNDYGYYPYRPGLRFISPDNIKHRFNDTIGDKTHIKVDFKELYNSLDNYINKNIPLHFYTLPQLMLLLIDDETGDNIIGSADDEFIGLCEGVSNLIPKEELPSTKVKIKISKK